MDFYAMLDKVIELLRSRGRVTYGALKLQFGLKDEQLEVLKDEIISAQRLATDEDGRILVWIGDTTGTANTTSPPTQPTQHSYPARSANAECPSVNRTTHTRSRTSPTHGHVL